MRRSLQRLIRAVVVGVLARGSIVVMCQQRECRPFVTVGILEHVNVAVGIARRRT